MKTSNAWSKKPRTMLRSIRQGDIFCFQLDEQRYAFGQILCKIFTGHVAVIFDATSLSPDAASVQLSLDRPLLDPLVIDSYLLFDKKREGDWRIVGHSEATLPAAMNDVHFIYGVGADRKKVDLRDQESTATDADALRYPILTPRRDPFIRSLVTQALENRP